MLTNFSTCDSILIQLKNYHRQGKQPAARVSKVPAPAVGKWKPRLLHKITDANLRKGRGENQEMVATPAEVTEVSQRDVVTLDNLPPLPNPFPPSLSTGGSAGGKQSKFAARMAAKRQQVPFPFPSR